jgi:hypothetical protein
VQPVCPSCHTVAVRVMVPSVASRVRKEGEVVLRCSSCQQPSFRYDSDLICAACDWLVPHANDILAERFEDNSGAFQTGPGDCPGCGHAEAQPPVDFPVACPKCGTGFRIPQSVVSPKTGVETMCPDKSCGFQFTIPPGVWCSECHLNLIPLNKIAELITELTDTDPIVWDNVKESPLDRTARRLVALVDIHDRWSRSGLSKEQSLLMFDWRLLDKLLSRKEPVEDWLRCQVEIRAIGHQLNQQGGMDLMVEVIERANQLSRGVLRIIEVTWDRIGEWRA